MQRRRILPEAISSWGLMNCVEAPSPSVPPNTFSKMTLVFWASLFYAGKADGSPARRLRHLIAERGDHGLRRARRRSCDLLGPCVGDRISAASHLP